MTSKTVTMEFTQLIILLCLVGYTVWVWSKSFNTCPKSFSEEYIALHQKYSKLQQEFKKMQQFMSSFGNVKATPVIEDDVDDINFDDFDI